MILSCSRRSKVKGESPTWPNKRMSQVVEISGEEVEKELLWLKGLLGSCYGPWGRQILLHSASGGVVALTKRSLKLLQLLKRENPLTKTLIAQFEAHARCYQDSTLYAGMLTCK